MTEPKGEQFYDSPAELGFALDALEIPEMTRQLRDRLFTEDTEVQQFALELGVTGDILREGPPLGVLYAQRALHHVDDEAFQVLGNGETIHAQYQALLEAVAVDPEAEIKDYVAMANAFLRQHPELIRYGEPTSTRTVTALSYEIEENYLEISRVSPINVQLLVALSDGTVARTPPGCPVVIVGESLPDHIKEAMAQFYRNYYEDTDTDNSEDTDV